MNDFIFDSSFCFNYFEQMIFLPIDNLMNDMGILVLTKLMN